MRCTSLLLVCCWLLSMPAEAKPAGSADGSKQTASRLDPAEVAQMERAPAEAPDARGAVGTDDTSVKKQAGAGGRASLPTIGVAPRVGLTIPTSKLGAFVIAGLSADYYLPVLNTQLSIGLDLAWSRPGYTGKINDARVGGAHDYDITVNQLKIALDIIYRILPHAETLNFYGGIGGGALLMRAKEDAPFIAGKQKQQSTAFTFELLVGADYRIGPGLAFAELRYAYAPLGYELTGDSNAGHVDVFAGYRLTF